MYTNGQCMCKWKYSIVDVFAVSVRLTVSVELNIGYVSRNEIVINMVIYCVAQDLKLHLLINHLASTHFSVSLVVAKS